MKQIVDFIQEFADNKGLDIIIDNTAGLNVDADSNISDRGKDGDKNTIFLNIIENGNMGVDEYGRKVTISHNYEIGLFKKCIKETDGISYYRDTQELLGVALQLFRALIKEYDIDNATYSNAIDNLDSNQVALKLEVTINEEIVDVCD